MFEIPSHWVSVVLDSNRQSDLTRRVLESEATSRPPAQPSVILGRWPEPSLRFKTVITGDVVEARNTHPRITALGRWTAEDPFYRATGLDLVADRKQLRYRADDLTFVAGSYRVTAKRFDLNREGGEAEDMKVRVSAGRVPLAGVDVKKLSYVPGGRSTAQQVSLSVLGIRLLTLKELPLKLAPTESGEKTLSTDIIPDQLGVTDINNPKPFASRWDIGGGVGLGLDQPIAWDIRLAYSLINSPVPIGAGFDEPDLKGSYQSSFYSVVRQSKPDEFVQRYRVPRLALVSISNFHKGYQDADRTAYGDRPLALGVEFGGPIASAGYRLQVRRETIRTDTRGTATRNLALGSIGLVNRDFARGWRVDARVDGMAIDQSGETYAWTRPMVGVTARVNPLLTTSAAYMYTARSNVVAPFQFDEVIPGSEVHMRTDWNFGNIQLGLLTRWSAAERGFYRSQAVISFPVGAFLPWFKYDSQYGNIAFGFSIRTDSLTKALQPRKLLPIPNPDPD